MKTAYRLLTAASALVLAFACSSKKDEPATLPTVTTADISELSSSAAKAGGEVTADGGAEVTARGIVYAEETGPTVEVSALTIDGTGTGIFESSLSELKSATTYHYRAYATNEAGTAYGEEKTFTTSLAETLSIDIDGIPMELVLVEPGTFKMGKPDSDTRYDGDYEKPVHNVTLTRSYYIGKFEVTQAQWIAVMEYNPSVWTGDDLPVHMVSYTMCQQFIAALNEHTGMTFSMPTEAQWEFAARGGNKSEGYMYSGSNDLKEVGWFLDPESTEEGSMHPCGQLKPNELGIYDMSGNAQEWVSDYFLMSGYDAEDQTDPTGPAEPSSQLAERCVRGGSIMTEDVFCTVYKRVGSTYSDNMGFDFGLRVVLNN